MDAAASIDMPFLVQQQRKRIGLSSLTRRKHSNAARGSQKAGHQLAKHLTALQLAAIGIGATLGAGVYVLVGTVARDKAGPSLSVSFLIAGVAAAFSAFCYAELASRCPSAGSAYHYAYTCVGEAVAWIIGWALILEYTLGGAAVARGLSPNLGILFGGADHLPSWLIRRTLPGTEIVCDPCAAAIVFFVTCLLSVGIKESAIVQSVMTTLNCCVLLFVVAAGIVVGYKTNWPGYKQEGGYMPFGISGTLGGAATVFFSYIGFDALASTAEEVKRPQRDLPIGIGSALTICSMLYMAVSAVIVGIVPFKEMDPDTPMSTAFSKHGMPWATYFVAVGAVSGLSTALLGSLLPQPRILMAMSRDGLLPPFFAKLHKTTSVPVHGTIITGLGSGAMAFFMDVDQLSGMVSVGTLMAFTIVGVSILILRYVPPLDPSTHPAAPPSPVTQKPVPKRDPVEVLQRVDEYLSPVLSIFSESSLAAGDEDASSVSSSTSSSELPLLEGDVREVHVQETEDTANKHRRRQAALSISTLCVGVVLLSGATSYSVFPSIVHWLAAIVGAILLIGGTVVLYRIGQDEGRHQFGQTGGFHCPGVPVLPVVSILINVYLLINLGAATWLRVSMWLVAGVLVYCSYGVHHSLLTKTG